MTILEERGVFWWHDEKIPENCFAPPSAVPGLLKITEAGNITLDLDGYLSGASNALSALLRVEECKGKVIYGILRGSDKHVVLLNLTSNGGRIANHGLSYTDYHAMHCLVSEEATAPEELFFHSLEIDLKGLEGWLRHRGSEVSVTGPIISVKHEEREPLIYKLDEGFITLKFYASGEGMEDGSHDFIKIADRTLIIFQPTAALDIADMQTKFLWINDLFIILTNSSFDLAWPRLKSQGSRKTRYNWYFLRYINKEEPPKYYNLPTNLPQLRNEFGSIISEWFKKRQALGPGLYLYLGTRRGRQIYAEHNFASLVWGIEALHRKKTQEDQPKGAKIKEKIARILSKVDARDKRWLSGKLRHAHEPALEERIFDVLGSFPNEQVDTRSLRAFAKKCADLRNQVSHFGEERSGGSYEEFVKDLRSHSEALARLYHALILYEIGVNQSIINDWLYRGFSSFATRSILENVGLLGPKQDA